MEKTVQEVLASADAQMAEYKARRRALYDRVVTRYEGKSGHAWYTGPYHRECVRCGLVVRSLACGARAHWLTVDGCGGSAVVLYGQDLDLPPCEDGERGEYKTAREAAPWDRAP